jgi:hypothetical protein
MLIVSNKPFVLSVIITNVVVPFTSDGHILCRKIVHVNTSLSVFNCVINENRF